MAACIIARRHGQLEVLQDGGGSNEDSDLDDNIDFNAVAREKMPTSAEAVLDSILLKLTSEYKWKPMRVVLTVSKLAMATYLMLPNGSIEPSSLDYLKDSIPLDQIIEIKTRTELPERQGENILQLSRHGIQSLARNTMEANSVNLHIIHIRTIPGGHNSGRDYYFNTEAETVCNEWIVMLKSAHTKAVAMREKAENEKMGVVSVVKKYLKQVCDSKITERTVAFLILTNFIFCIARAQRYGTEASPFFDIADIIFTLLFTVELMVNIAGNWLWPFLLNGWNIFDFIVVTISLAALMLTSVPGITQLRLIRILRWNRATFLSELLLLMNVIIVLNSFLILGIVIALYAILAVTFFAHRDHIHFGTFTRSFFTVCTGDGWAKDIARGLMDGDGLDPGVVLYFVSFVVIVGWTLVQVVVAVLLDNFMTAAWNETKARRKLEMEQEGRGVEVCVLDPLLEALSYFESLSNLRKQISNLFQLYEGFKKLPFEPQVLLQPEDFDDITKNRWKDQSLLEYCNRPFTSFLHRELCNRRGQLGPAEFENLGLFVQRQMAEAMASSEQKNANSMLFFVTKVLAINLEEMASTFRMMAESDSKRPRRSSIPEGTLSRGSAAESRDSEEGVVLLALPRQNSKKQRSSTSRRESESLPPTQMPCEPNLIQASIEGVGSSTESTATEQRCEHKEHDLSQLQAHVDRIDRALQEQDDYVELQWKSIREAIRDQERQIDLIVSFALSRMGRRRDCAGGGGSTDREQPRPSVRRREAAQGHAAARGGLRARVARDRDSPIQYSTRSPSRK